MGFQTVTIELEITYLGKRYAIDTSLSVELYRQSAIDHEYYQIKKHVMMMLEKLLYRAGPVHPNNPEIEDIGRKLLKL